MALLYSRSRSFLSLLVELFDHLSVDSSRVCRISSSRMLPVCRIFQEDSMLVEYVAEFLHRDRLHCVLVLLMFVLVFVFECLRR